MSGKITHEELDLQESGGIDAAIRNASQNIKGGIRDSVPESYREQFDKVTHSIGMLLAGLVLVTAGYFMLDILWLAVATVLGLGVEGIQYTVAIRVLQFIVLALAWDLLGGQMGYASFGNMAFFGLGVYTGVVLLKGTIPAIGQHGFIVALIAAGLICLVYAMIVGFPLLRLRGHYFAVATLGVLVATQQYVASLKQTGGGAGVTLPQAGFANVDQTFYFLSLGLAVVTFLAYWYLTNARFGFGLNAIRDDEGKARSMGLHTTKYKIIAWGVAAFFTGIAGLLFGVHNAYVNPTVAFRIEWGVMMILMALVGGLGRLWGPVIGAVFLWNLRNTLWSNPPWLQTVIDVTGIPLNDAYLLIFGLILIGIVIGAPDGVLGYLDKHGAFRPIRTRAQGTPLEALVEEPEQ